MKNKNLIVLTLLGSLILFAAAFVDAQIFAPMAFWRTKNNLTTRCYAGCYPTPTTPFTSALYYVPINTTAQFQIVSSSNPTGAQFCWGPTAGGGCTATPTYPLACTSTSANAVIDGSLGASTNAYYTPIALIASDTCYVTDFAENRNQSSVTIQTFTPVAISSPITSAASPRNVCVNQTQAITAAGGLGTLAWTIFTGGGTRTPTTGVTTTYTAPATASTVEVRVTDPTTSMYDTAYINVVSAITLSPLATTIETPVNSNTFMQDPTTSAGTAFVMNLTFSGNCGTPPFTASCTGGGVVSPTSGIAANAAVQFKPASSDSTLTVTFTDSVLVTATRTVNMIVPNDISNSWGYHTCIKYSHSTYTAGTYKLKCFGYNNAGQLGYGNTTTKGNLATDLGFGLLFIKNTGTTGADIVVKDVSTGLGHTCAILSDNTVKCWGSNTYGQLGYDNTTSLTSPSASTVNIGAGTPSKLYASGFKTCLVFSDSRVKCWGRNTNGELGQNNTLNYGSDASTSSMANLGYISVAGAALTVTRVAGTENGTCVLANASFTPSPAGVYCWGYGNSGTCAFGTMPDTNYCGELGRATTNANWGSGTNLMSALTAVNLSLTGSETVIDIAAGRKHVCAIIAATSVSTAGNPICWGYNAWGQLGIDNTTTIGDNEAPTTRISGMTTATRLELGAQISCAILTGGSSRCWGYGNNGQLLGSGNTGSGNYSSNMGDNGSPLMSAIVAMEYGTGLTVKKMAVGYTTSCSILNNDFIKCWGAQYCGVGSNTKKNNGCIFSGIAANLDNGNGSPTTLDSKIVGDASGEVGNNLPYVSH